MTKLGNKQCILDPFPVNILNTHKHSIVSEITKLVNCSLISGDFPKNLKEAVVKPMIKNKSLGPVESNYRPISNLPYLSKILETVVLEQITKYCEENNLLPRNQSAYRKGFSCETMLLKLADSLLNNMESRSISSYLFRPKSSLRYSKSQYPASNI
jgi:potassium voltage-gated channel Eag-related subfamily H protein 8